MIYETIRSTDPGLVDRCFAALETHDPALGAIFGTITLTGIRAADLEQLPIEAIDLTGRTIEPLVHSFPLAQSYRRDLAVLPISDVAAPLLTRLVDDARAKGRPTLIPPATTLPRWRKVRESAALGNVPRHAFRELFAATLTGVTEDVDLIDRCLWRRCVDVAGENGLKVADDPADIAPLYDAVAERLAPMVVRPAFTAVPG